MTARGRLAFGVLFAAVGVAAWTVLLWAYEPVGRPAHLFPEGPYGDSRYGLAAGRDVRLSALVLGVGGLLLVARNWRPGVWLALALGVAWAGGDFVLDADDVNRLVTVVVAGLAVAVAVAAIIVVSARRREVASLGRASWLLVYAGMAVGVATVGNPYTGSVWLSWHLPVFVAVLLSAVVAGAAVNSAGTPITGWPLAASLVALAVALFLYRYVPGIEMLVFRDGSWLLFEVFLAATFLVSPSVAAAAIAMTGALSGRRAIVAVPVVVLALLPASKADTMPALVWLSALVDPDYPLGRQYLPGQVLAGLLLGLTAWVLARLAPVVFGSAGADPARSARRWPMTVGFVLAGLGVVCWAVAAAVVTPVAMAVGEGRPISIHTTAPLIGWATNLRWAAILLAWGGLLLAARTRGRARWLAAGVLAWLAADLAITAVGVEGWLAAGVCALVAGAGLFAVTLVRTTEAGGPAGSAVYAAAAAGAGIEMMVIKAWMPQYLPAWAFQFGLAVTVLLVVAAVAHTLTVESAVRANQLIGASVVAVAGFGGAVLHYVTARPETERGSDDWVQLTLVAAVAVAATASALVSIGTSRRRWWAASGAVLLVAIGALPLFVGAATLAFLPQDLALGLAGRHGLIGEWFNDTIAGAVCGAAIALLALWPRALSVPDGPLATEPPPASVSSGP